MNRIAVTLGSVLLWLSIASVGAQGPAAAVSVEPPTLGAADFTVFYPFDGDRFSMTGDGSLMPVPRTEWTKRTMEQQFDAILYIGAPPTITYARLSPKLCLDPTYMTMRFERFALIGLTAGTEQLKKFCAEAATQQP